MSDSIPDFAKIAPNNNNDNYADNNINRNVNVPNQNSSSPNLPLWAVVLIVVFLLVVFVAIVSMYFHCKRKLKKNRLKKHRMMLQMSGQQYQPSIHNNSLWNNNWNNGGYEENETIRASYYSGQNKNWTQNNIKTTNTFSDENCNSTKSNTLIRNETETLKRKAPPPPTAANSEQLYENLRMNENKLNTIHNSPQLLFQQDNDASSITTQPININDVPAIMKTSHQEMVEPQWPVSHPINTRSGSRHQPDILRNDVTDDTSFASQSGDETIDEADPESSDEEDSIKDNSSTESEKNAENNYKVLNDQENTDLMGILTQWKEHLFAQKNELQDYYNRLTGYVESVVVQPMDSVSNVGIEQTCKNQFDRLENQANETRKKKRRLPSYPLPPESVIDDVRCLPDDIEGQQKVISNLRTRLSELEQLLQNPKEFEEEARQNSIMEKNELTTQHYSLQKQQKRIKEKQKIYGESASFQSKHKTAPKRISSNKNKMHTLQKNERVNIQKLLAQLSRKEGENLMKKIIKLQQVSKEHVQAMTLDGDKEHIASLRFARQVHHVMRDVVNPRLQTNMLLATAAACNLTSKMVKSFHSADKAKFEAMQEPAKLLDRLTGLVRHMNDMCKQLSLRIESYYKDDIYRFIDAFLVMAMKVLNATRNFIIDAKIKATKKEKIHSEKKSTNTETGLMSSEVEQLSNGLIKLETLLKSGKLPSFDLSSLPRKNIKKDKLSYSLLNQNEESDSCGSDCDAYSYTSCSTCLSDKNIPEKSPRNPYLFPGNPISKNVPYRTAEATTLPPNYGNTRPPTRPRNSQRPSQESYSKIQSPTSKAQGSNTNLYLDGKPENAFVQASPVYDIDSKDHEVLLAKYLNELLKTQSDKQPLTLPPGYNSFPTKEKMKESKSLDNSAEKIPNSLNKMQTKPSAEKRGKTKQKKSTKKNNKPLTTNEDKTENRPSKIDDSKVCKSLEATEKTSRNETKAASKPELTSLNSENNVAAQDKEFENAKLNSNENIANSNKEFQRLLDSPAVSDLKPQLNLSDDNRDQTVCLNNEENDINEVKDTKEVPPTDQIDSSKTSYGTNEVIDNTQNALINQANTNEPSESIQEDQICSNEKEEDQNKIQDVEQPSAEVYNEFDNLEQQQESKNDQDPNRNAYSDFNPSNSDELLSDTNNTSEPLTNNLQCPFENKDLDNVYSKPNSLCEDRKDTEEDDLHLNDDRGDSDLISEAQNDDENLNELDDDDDDENLNELDDDDDDENLNEHNSLDVHSLKESICNDTNPNTFVSNFKNDVENEDNKGGGDDESSDNNDDSMSESERSTLGISKLFNF